MYSLLRILLVLLQIYGVSNITPCNNNENVGEHDPKKKNHDTDAETDFPDVDGRRIPEEEEEEEDAQVNAYLFIFKDGTASKKAMVQVNVVISSCQNRRYAKNLCNETIRQTRRFSRKMQWQKEGKLTIPEFKGFLAVFFNMGLIRKVSFEEYWNKHSPSQSTPWFRCMFSRNRFQNILKFLHLVDTKKLPKRNDPAYKPSQRFKPLLDFVNRKFLRYYNPHRELAVDESLVGTKGKTSMLQYIPSKRSRFGVKFWMLVESVTGYVLQMDVYHGKRFDPTPAGTLQGTNVVINLMKNSHLLGKGFHVFADSFFASLNLANKLLRERTAVLLNQDTYKYSCCGFIYQWEFYTSSTGTIEAQVWRRGSGNIYTLVGSNTLTATKPSCSFWTERTKDSCMTGEAPIAKSTMKSNKILEDKTTQSLIAIEERRLKTEEERLCGEKQRLTMESERLDIERQRFNIEQQKHQLYLAQMNINFAQMVVQVLDQQTLNTPDDA
ncbi:unnamed protein product [Mytilus coruscus]|uniref:PiggyBac transposable element-derived protein domain-containing protein n=1 Tax=Mytilus coruscus TaxID=42192 RepID=A0A6J8CR22_MYTCO|nr:unnamed protein product [Mytilus coruscus]